MTRKVVEATRPYLELPHFTRDIIANKSKAAAGLCDWAINIVKYFDVVIDVAPKKAELAEANEKLHNANETLTSVMAKVAELNAMVADLEAQFDAANKDKDDAIKEQEHCDRKLSYANRLITALASEGERWASTVEQLKLDHEVRAPLLLGRCCAVLLRGAAAPVLVTCCSCLHMMHLSHQLESARVGFDAPGLTRFNAPCARCYALPLRLQLIAAPVAIFTDSLCCACLREWWLWRIHAALSHSQHNSVRAPDTDD